MVGYKTIREISNESGASLPTIYKRLRLSGIETHLFDGIIYIKEEDTKLLLTKRKRGRRPHAQKAEQENIG